MTVRFTFFRWPKKLIDYTLDLTDNAKRFPKRVRFSITNKIQGHVMAIYDGLLEANEIFPIRTEADRQNGFVYKGPP